VRRRPAGSLQAKTYDGVVHTGNHRGGSHSAFLECGVYAELRDGPSPREAVPVRLVDFNTIVTCIRCAGVTPGKGPWDGR